MKKISYVLVALFSLSALASNPQMFLGRFEILAEGNCMVDPGSRAYVTMNKNFYGAQMISFQYYGEEARLDEVIIQNGKFQHLGNSCYTDTVTVTWPKRNMLKSKIVTKGKNFGQNINYVTEYTLERNGNIVTITETTDGREQNSCKLFKY